MQPICRYSYSLSTPMNLVTEFIQLGLYDQSTSFQLSPELSLVLVCGWLCYTHLMELAMFTKYFETNTNEFDMLRQQSTFSTMLNQSNLIV